MKRRHWVTLALLFTLGGPSIMAQSTTACKLNPTNRTVTICTPEGRSSTSPVESPVRVVAGCADSTPISIIQIYIDGQRPNSITDVRRSPGAMRNGLGK